MVVEQEPIALQLTPEALEFRALGDTLRLVADAADANGHPVEVAWSSSEPTVAQVDASGLVTEGLTRTGTRSRALSGSGGHRASPRSRWSMLAGSCGEPLRE